MGKTTLYATIIAFAAFAALPASAASVAGRTIKYHNSRGQTYWITYRKNGTFSAKSTRAGGDPGYIYDTGTWTYENGRVCESYAHWGDGATHCR